MNNIPFKLHKIPIDYFELKDEYFSNDEFIFSKSLLELQNESYINHDTIFNEVDLEKIETVVFNFQVGKGKTVLFYRLIRDYIDKGYKVLICSPFLKLVAKDVEAVIGMYGETPNLNPIKIKFPEIYKGPETIKPGKGLVFYGDKDQLSKVDPGVLDNGDSEYFYQSAPRKFPVHVMTINTLLGNAENDSLEQTFVKRKYIDNLLKECRDKNAVLFLDELHASAHNFKPELIPNFFKWKDKLQKIFIASATFNPSTIPIIKTASLLTEKSIRVFESLRSKNKIQSNLFLHVFHSYYSSKSTSLLSSIKKLTAAYNKNGEPINIITGTKALAVNLVNHCYKNKVINDVENVKKNRSLEYCNLLTNETNIQFQANQNNVGTTFKTGVNIKNSNSALLIVFPSIRNENDLQYGIFTEGISAVIQAVGRMRNGGDIHLFFSDPKCYIGELINYPKTFQEYDFFEHQSINQSYDFILEKYQKKLQAVRRHVRFMEAALHKRDAAKIGKDFKTSFGFWYLNIHEYLLKYGSILPIKKRNPSFGRMLSPYILWASVYDQFANARLKSILYYEFTKVIDLRKGDTCKIFFNLLNRSNIKEIGFRKSLSSLVTHLKYEQGVNGEYVFILYKIIDKVDPNESQQISSSILINKEHYLTRIAIQALYKICTNEDYEFNDKYEYIRICIHNAYGRSSMKSISKLDELYLELGSMLEEFSRTSIQQFNGSIDTLLIDKKGYNVLTEDFINQADDLISLLRKEDYLFNTKAISFLQHWETDKKERRKIIFNEFSKIAYNEIGTKRIKGIKYSIVEMVGEIGNTRHNFLA